MRELVSIAIETSCRYGGVALGLGERLAAKIDFDAASRHATHLVVRLRDLVSSQGLGPSDVNEVYVSAGPGSFTGVRVGITVARTLAQAVPGLRCVAVSSAAAVAQNAAGLDWQHLAVILDAKDDLVYAQTFSRPPASQVPPRQRGLEMSSAEPAVVPLAEFLAAAPKPLTLIGEGLIYHQIDPAAFGPGQVTPADPSICYPTAEGVWTVGRRLASAGQFTEYHHLLPIYARRSEAERLWDLRHGAAQK
jgi:tRNA threonylcarbamoyladenosine biosynthesis protein TsaB